MTSFSNDRFDSRNENYIFESGGLTFCYFQTTFVLEAGLFFVLEGRGGEGGIKITHRIQLQNEQMLMK